MKKVLWTLSAMALLGLGAYGCGSDECDDSECPTGQKCVSTNPLTGLLGEKHCDWPCGKQCAANEECVEDIAVPECKMVCDEGQVRDNEGYCVSDEAPSACKSKEDCEDGYDCINDECVPEGSSDPVYKYVRLDDMSKNTTGREDPGADIDTIVLKKKDGAQILPTSVVYFVRADGERANVDRSVAQDPEIVKEISSFIAYPNIEECYLYTKTSVPTDKDNRQYAYVSLGGQKDGKSGVLIVEMGGSIEDGDTLDVLEVGNCDLKNTESGKEQTAKNDPVTVYISVSDDYENGDWKLIHTADEENDKGVISIGIDFAKFKL